MSNTNRNTVNGKSKKMPDLKYGLYAKKSNDPRWYMSDTMAKDVANFSYPYVLGSKYDMGWPNTAQYYEEQPGIATVEYMPMFGGSKSMNVPSEALNAAMNNFYSFVRHLNSGNANADADDYLKYVISLSSCYSVLAHARRLYGLLSEFDIDNWYKPEALVTAMGFDYDDFMKNKPAFRAFLNNYALKISTLVLPSGMPFVEREQWMYEKVYKDRENDRAQIMMILPHGFYRYSENTGEPGKLGDCEYMPFFPDKYTTPITLNTLEAYMNMLIEDNRWSQDHNIISGDIMKAYQGNVITAPQIQEDYKTDIVHDNEFLMQWANMTVMPKEVSGSVSYMNAGVRSIATNNGFKLVNYVSANLPDNSAATKIITGNRILNFVDSVPTPDQQLEATRFMCIPKEVTNIPSVDVLYFDSCIGFCLNGSIWVGGRTGLSRFTFEYVLPEFNSPSADKELHLGAYLQWHVRPEMLLELAHDSTVSYIPTQEKEYFTIVDGEELARINSVAMFGLLGIQ